MALPLPVKTKKSKIWDYYTLQDSSRGKAICNKCKAVLSNIDGCTTAMTKHINVKHGINIQKNRLEMLEDEPSKKTTKTILDFTIVVKRSLDEIVSRLATVDGISIRAIIRSEFIRESIMKCGYVLPKNESDVMKLIYKDFETKKQIMINELQGKFKKNKRFSITLDEWTSVAMKRFVNINLHDNEFKTLNLGLVRIYGSCSASALVELVTNHLNTFNINFEKDVVSSTNDGAKIMIKYGRECPAICQLCLNHGLHLAICDTLYKNQIVLTTITNEILIYDTDNDIDSNNENFENDNDINIICSNESESTELELK